MVFLPKDGSSGTSLKKAFCPSQSRLQRGGMSKSHLVQELQQSGSRRFSSGMAHIELVELVVELDAKRFYKTLSDEDLVIVFCKFALKTTHPDSRLGLQFDREATIEAIARCHASSDFLRSLPSPSDMLQRMVFDSTKRCFLGMKKWDLINILIEDNTRHKPGFGDPLKGTSLSTSNEVRLNHPSRSLNSRNVGASAPASIHKTPMPNPTPIARRLSSNSTGSIQIITNSPVEQAGRGEVLVTETSAHTQIRSNPSTAADGAVSASEQRQKEEMDDLIAGLLELTADLPTLRITRD